MFRGGLKQTGKKKLKNHEKASGNNSLTYLFLVLFFHNISKVGSLSAVGQGNAQTRKHITCMLAAYITSFKIVISTVNREGQRVRNYELDNSNRVLGETKQPA